MDRCSKDRISSDKKHGVGILYFKNADLYMGEFKEGFITGLGVYIFQNGERYQG
jgi:hypothetical protein